MDENNVIPLKPRQEARDTSTQRDIAAWWEAAFQARGQSLTNPDTARTTATTAAVLGQLLDGAQQLGHITPEQQDYLTGILSDAIDSCKEWHRP